MNIGFDMFVGYIQNNHNQSDYAEQYQKLSSFAKEQGLSLMCVHLDDTFDNIKSLLQSDCEGILINRISCMGSCLQTIKDNLQFCQEKNLKLLSIDDSYCFDKTNLSEDFFKGMDVAIDIRSHLISQSTRKVLSQRKKEGKKLGRPFGAKVKSKLENNSEKIMQMFDAGISKSEIARRLGINRASIYAFARRRGISFSRGDK